MLVRHGEVFNPDGVAYGRLPRFGLSDIGRQEAAQAAVWLSDYPIDTIFCSPMLRTRQTAKILADQLPLEANVKQTKHLIEIHSPHDGRPLAELRQMGWDLYRGIDEAYEQPEDIIQRLHRWTAQVRRDYPGKHIVGVTHGDVIMYQCMWAEGVPFEHEKKLAFAKTYYQDEYLHTASISTFSYKSDALEERPTFRYTRVKDATVSSGNG